MPVNVIDTIVPKNSGQFPVVEDVNVEGGFQVQPTIVSMDNIPSSNRKSGMLVYVIANSTYYQLANDLVTWNVANLGGSSTLIGDVTGNVGLNTVVKLQNKNVANLAPTDAQAFAWQASGNNWTPVSLQVSTVTQLRAVPPVTATAVINLQGFGTGGDGGAGTFYWNSSSTLPDDGGTIFQVTGISTGRWIRLFSGPLNVAWFGVLPTVSDCTAAMTLVINAANAQGRMIYVPHGTYNFAASGAATNPLPVISTGLGIMEDPNEISLFLFNNTDGDCLVMRGTTQIINFAIANQRVSALTNSSAVVRLINPSYGFYSNLNSANGAVNNISLLIEQRYDLFSVTGTTGNGVSPIIATVPGHNFQTGELVRFAGIGGNTNANGDFTVTVIDSSHVSLNSSTGNGSYTSGGQCVRVYDSYLLAHVGCWYNKFSKLTLNYDTVGVNLGYGLSFTVNANALGVINPLGQVPGTYNGQVSFNTVRGVNIEGHSRGISLSNCFSNIFIGGQMLGCTDQIYARNSGVNTFIGMRHNQWTNSAFNFDSTCDANGFLLPSFFNVISQPWQLGPDSTIANTLGSNATFLCGSDGTNLSGILLRGGLMGPDGYYAIRPYNIISGLPGTIHYNGNIHEFFDASGGTTAQVKIGSDISLSRPSASLLQIDDGGGAAQLLITGGIIQRPDGHGAAIQFGNGFCYVFNTFNRLNALGSIIWETMLGANTVTTDATPTDIAVYQMPSNSAANLRFEVNARRTGGSRGTGAVGDSAGFTRIVRTKMVGANSGTPVELGSVKTPWADDLDSDLSSASISIALSVTTGGIVKITATGAVNLNLDWRSSVHIEPVNF